MSDTVRTSTAVSPNAQGLRVLRFADCEVGVAARELRREGRPVPLQPRVFDLLVCLLRNRDRVVGKGELRRAVWGEAEVSAFAVTQAVKALRRAVGDDGTAQRVIRTVRGRGYRFVSPVVDAGAGAPRESAAGRATHAEVVQHLERALSLLRELASECAPPEAAGEVSPGSCGAHDPMMSATTAEEKGA
jgi:DNA-binding winged helix-turn-helix (wHTH) protein